jgi:hypothetical protein
MHDVLGAASAPLRVRAELCRVGKGGVLPLLAERDGAAADEAWAVRAATPTVPALARKGVEPLVEGALLPRRPVVPGKALRPRAHGSGSTGGIELAAGREKPGARVPLQLTELALVLLGERGALVIRTDSPRPTADDEGTSREILSGKHALAFGADVLDNDVLDHRPSWSKTADAASGWKDMRRPFHCEERPREVTR